MPLYIRDDEVAALARKLQAMSRSPTVTDAVRTALRNEIDRQRAAVPLAVRLRKAQDLADAIGRGAAAAPEAPP